MNYLSQSIFAFAAALMLPLSLSAAPDEPQTDAQAQNEDNITLMMTPVEEDPTTAFINLDNSEFFSPANDELTGEIIDYATKHLGRPYRSGAKGPSAFDCSGFTSYVFKKFDIALSPSSRTQYTQGRKISLDEVRPGDLLFFAGRRGGKTVGHVGMAVDVNEDGSIKFIHAATSKGITYGKYPDGGYYSKRYIGARRVID